MFHHRVVGTVALLGILGILAACDKPRQTESEGIPRANLGTIAIGEDGHYEAQALTNAEAI